MNTCKLIILAFCLAAFAAQAQDSSEKRTDSTATKTTAQASAAQTSTVQSATARKPSRASKPAAGSPDSISAAPGTVLTLCCGSLDPHSMAGSNCAYMHTGQGCGGFILACPEGTSETVKKDGSGYCKDND